MATRSAFQNNSVASSSRRQVVDSPKLRIVRDPSARIRQAVRGQSLRPPHSLIADNNVALLQRLQNKADLRNTDKGRLTSLSWAAAELSLEVFEWLLVDYGHDDQELSKDADDNTILHILAAIPTPPGIPPTLNPKYMDLPPVISDRTPGEQSALALRMTHIYVTLFPFVMDWPNAGGKTALHVAAQAGNSPFIALLADFGADIDMTDHQGNTPLHYAAAWGHMEAIRTLLEKGAQYTPRNLENAAAADYAYSYAIYNGLSGIVREIFDNAKKRQKEERYAERQAAESGGRHRSESTSTANSLASGLGSLHSSKSGNAPLQFDPSTMPPPSTIPQRLVQQSPALGYPQSGGSSARNTPPMSRQGSEGLPPQPHALQMVDGGGGPSRPSPVARSSPSLPSRSDSLPSTTGRPVIDHRPSFTDTVLSSTSGGSGSIGPPRAAPISLGMPLPPSSDMPPPNMAAMGSVAARRANSSQAIHGFQSADGGGQMQRSQTGGGGRE